MIGEKPTPQTRNRPSRRASIAWVRLAAYSCGGSHGLGPDWVVRTVFPINPLEFIRRGTIARDDTRAPNPDQSGFAFAMERQVPILPLASLAARRNGNSSLPTWPRC